MLYFVFGRLFSDPAMFRMPPLLVVSAQLENSEVLPFGSVAVAETGVVPPTAAVSERSLLHWALI